MDNAPSDSASADDDSAEDSDDSADSNDSVDESPDEAPESDAESDGFREGDLSWDAVMKSVLVSAANHRSTLRPDACCNSADPSLSQDSDKLLMPAGGAGRSCQAATGSCFAAMMVTQQNEA